MMAHLIDTWRWWASGGAAVAIGPLAVWAWAMITSAEMPVTRKSVSAIGGAAMLGFLLAILLLGAMIPFANSDRVAGFSRDSAEYQLGMAVGWLLLGAGAWGVAISFARSKPMMAVVCIGWWWAMAFATIETMGVRP